MALPQEASSFCLFCYNGLSSCGDSANSLENIKSFTTNLFRFVGDRDCKQSAKLVEQTINEFTLSSECLNCCEECQVIINKFLQFYHQLKCVELQLDLNLENLLGKIEVSSRVPKRWKNVRKIMECSRMESSLGTIEKSQYLILKIRQMIIKSGVQRSASSIPRVLVERHNNGSVYNPLALMTNEIPDESINKPNTTDPVIKMEFEDSQSEISETEFNISTDLPTSSPSVLNISSKAISKVCDICSLNCAPDQLELHLKTYHDLTNVSNDDDIHRCKVDQCRAYFLTKNQYNIHYLQKHHKKKKLGTLSVVYNDGVKYFLCKFCKTPFNKVFLLRKHLTTSSCGKEASDNQGTPVECSECNEIFDKKEDLWKHQSQVHSSAQNRVCTKCGKCFDRKWNFKMHLEYHKGPSEWKWKCVYCSKKFVNEALLKRHVTSHDKPNKSGLKRGRKACGEHTQNRRDLKATKWECKECGRRLSSKYRLIQHKRLHTGDKPYSCHLCKVTFAYSHHVKRHLREIHGVSDEQLIPTRARTKTGESFSCHFCPITFASRYNLVRHSKSRHGNEIEKISENSNPENGNESLVDVNSVEIEESAHLEDPLKQEALDSQSFPILDEIY